MTQLAVQEVLTTQGEMADRNAQPGRVAGDAAAGLADMAYGQVEGASRKLHSQLDRADITNMARDGHEDLTTRTRWLCAVTPGLFSRYSIPLGKAYQLRDDLLGVFGDPQRTGKSKLDDMTGTNHRADRRRVARGGDR
jgi:hypothetical protein